MLLLDTNVVSELRKRNCDLHVQAWMADQAAESMYVSAITVLEIERGIVQVTQRGDVTQAEALSRWLDDMVLPAFAGRILPVDHIVARRAAGLPWPDPRDYRDALIAATALVHGATVVTRNVKHFEASGVLLVNPWRASSS